MLPLNLIVPIRVANRALSSVAVPITKKEHCKHNNLSETKESEKPPGWDAAKPFTSIPGPKPIPLIGNLWRFLPGGEYYGAEVKVFHAKLKEKYGNFVAVRGIPGPARDIYVSFDPSDFETMHRNEGTWPIRVILGSALYYRSKIRNDVFQNVYGLLSSDGEEWYKFRSIVNPILMQPKTIVQYTGTMNEIADEMINLIKLQVQKNPEMPEDFLNLFNKWALESVGAVGLDERLGCLDPNLPADSPHYTYINNVLEALELMYKLDILPSLWKYFNTKNWKRYVEILDNITFTNLEYIERALKRMEDGPKKSENEMSMLEKLVKKDKRVALAMIMDMLFAGVDTTSRTIGAATYFLAKNPDKQDLLRKEALRLLPSKNTPVTKEILADAPYLKAVLKETTRFAPIASGNVRKIAKDAVIGGYQVPKGTNVVTAQLYVATSDEHVKRSKEFLPERWLRDSTNSEISHKNMHSFVTLPFGFGPRSCIGKRLANLELEIGLLKIIRNFELSWHHDDMPFAAKLLYGIEGPLKLHLKNIDS